MSKLKFKIADVAKRNGLTNAHGLQKKLECSPTLAARLWKGNFKQISIETIERLCDSFDCVPADLYTYTGKNSSTNAPQSPAIASESTKRQSAKADESKPLDELPALDDKDDLWLSTKEAAEYTNREPRTVRDFYKQGLPRVEITGKGSFVRLTDLTAFLKSRR